MGVLTRGVVCRIVLPMRADEARYSGGAAAMQEIADWLEKIGMSEHAQRFAEKDIDASVLRHLTDQSLKTLGVTLGHRLKISSCRQGAGRSHASAASTRYSDRKQDRERRRVQPFAATAVKLSCTGRWPTVRSYDGGRRQGRRHPRPRALSIPRPNLAEPPMRKPKRTFRVGQRKCHRSSMGWQITRSDSKS
jgi:SAM domain (Sterile alpha motif)